MIPYRFNQHRGRKFMYNISSISNHVDAAPISLGDIIVNILSVMRPPHGATGNRINLFQLKFDYRRAPHLFLLTVMPQALRVKASTNSRKDNDTKDI
jgi:hypothetical protein